MNLRIRQGQIEDYDLTESVVKAVFANAEHSVKKVTRIRKSKEFIPRLSLVVTDKCALLNDLDHLVE